jgi:hypothetical protein
MTLTARAHSSTYMSSWAADRDALSDVQTLVQKTAVGSTTRAAPGPIDAFNLAMSTALAQHPSPGVSQDVCCDLPQLLPRERPDLNPS